MDTSIKLFSFVASTIVAHLPLSKGKIYLQNSKSWKQHCAATITQFFEGIAYQYPDIHFDDTLKKRVEESMREAGISSETLGRIQPYIDSGVNIALTCYAHTSPLIQEAVALYTSYAISIDDLGHEFADEMKIFVSDLLGGKPSNSTILLGFLGLMSGYKSQFGQFGGNMIVKSSIDFVCGCYLELGRESGASGHDTIKAPEYAEYLRIKTGVAEAYAFFLFPEELFPESELLHSYLPAIPYIVQYFNYVNDLLSFYKEADERTNYINNHAVAHNITPLESLEIVCRKSVDIFHTINAILAPNEALRDVVQRFMYGYAVYHMCSRRYRLSELDVPAVLEARRLLFQEIDLQK
jgi:Trichodiene synthase (TRI5)